MGDFGAGLAQGAAGSTAQAVDRNSQQKLVRDKSAQDALLTREMAAENAALQRELEKSRAENAMALERMRGESARTLQRDSLDVNKPLVDANVEKVRSEAETARERLGFEREVMPTRRKSEEAQADMLGAQAAQVRETTKGMVSQRPLDEEERRLKIEGEKQRQKFAATMHDFGVKGAAQGLKQGDLAIRQLERSLARAVVVEDMEDRKTAISLALTSSEAAKQMMADALAPLGLDPESAKAKEEQIFAVTMAVMQNPALQQRLTLGKGGEDVSAIMAAMRNELTDTVAGSMRLDENLQGEISTSTDLVRTLLVGGDVAAATAETARMAKKLDGVTGARKQEVEGAKVQRKLLERQNAPMPNWGPEAQRQYGTWAAWDAERKRRAGR